MYEKRVRKWRRKNLHGLFAISHEILPQEKRFSPQGEISPTFSPFISSALSEQARTKKKPKSPCFFLIRKIMFHLWYIAYICEQYATYLVVQCNTKWVFWAGNRVKRSCLFMGNSSRTVVSYQEIFPKEKYQGTSRRICENMRKKFLRIVVWNDCVGLLCFSCGWC